MRIWKICLPKIARKNIFSSDEFLGIIMGINQIIIRLNFVISNSYRGYLASLGDAKENQGLR
jgi:hypothetical protein